MSDTHIERTRSALEKCMVDLKRVDQEKRILESAIRELRGNIEWNLLSESGLLGHLVETRLGEKFVVKNWIEPGNLMSDGYPVLSGPHINRRGEVSPTWEGRAPPSDVKDLGIYRPPTKRKLKGQSE